jgi:hypothetical protein
VLDNGAPLSVLVVSMRGKATDVDSLGVSDSRLRGTSHTSQRLLQHVLELTLLPHPPSPLQLFTDMVFADFLVSHVPSVTHATFHPKSIPWFVSDVLPRDYNWLLSSLADPTGLFADLSAEDEAVLKELGRRWSGFVEDGIFRIQPSEDGEGDFWVRGDEYQRLPELAPKLAKTLSGSRLVIFKGDLKCVGLLLCSVRPTVCLQRLTLVPSAFYFAATAS